MACYAKQNGTLALSATGGSCGASSKNGSGVETCCAIGDTCLSDGFCQYIHSGNPGGSGYYMAGCTDPNFKDPACPMQCVDQVLTDAVYNFTTGSWACCGVTGGPQGVRQCMDPMGATFQAPAPGSLQKLQVVSEAGLAPAAASTAPSNPQTTQGAGDNNSIFGRGPGLVIGITAAASVLFVGLVALGAFLCYRKKRKAKVAVAESEKSPPSWSDQSATSSPASQMSIQHQQFYAGPSEYSKTYSQSYSPSQPSQPSGPTNSPPVWLSQPAPVRELPAREPEPGAPGEPHQYHAELANGKSPHPMGFV